MITAGIDIGGKNIKVLLLDNQKVIAKVMAIGGFNQTEVAEKLLEQAAQQAGIETNQIERTAATGSGKKFAPSYDVDITEIGAVAKGGSFILPSARTIIDSGSEDSRGVKVENGLAKDFATNDKCAAGAGAFIEAMARAIEVSLEDFGKISLLSNKKVPINAQCAVFAESEVVSLINSKTKQEDIARAVNDALAERVVAMMKRIGVEKDILVVGGLSKNVGYVDALKHGFNSEVIVPDDPQYVCALGAALAASEN